MEAQRQVGGGSLLLICHLSLFSSISSTASSAKSFLGLHLGPLYRLHSGLDGNEHLALPEVLTELCAGLVCPLHTVGA